MSHPHENTVDDSLAVQYLLGNLPQEEIERLDELSIADDNFAARLAAVEDDLVDEYVRGELQGEVRDRFQSSYLASPKRRKKVEFAEAFLARLDRAIVPAPPRPLAAPVWRMRWAFALALVMLGTIGALAVANLRLRNQVAGAQMDAYRAKTEADRQIQVARSTAAKTATVAFFLEPPVRGAGPMATVVIPPAAGGLEIQLGLEVNSFEGYTVALKSAAADRTLWQSGALQSKPLGKGAAVSVSPPLSLLRDGDYLLELSGIPTHGAVEILGDYSFRLAIPH